MEKLDYLIRTLTYLRSVKELEMKKFPNSFVMKRMFLNGEIQGINIAITEIFKLIEVSPEVGFTVNDDFDKAD